MPCLICAAKCAGLICEECVDKCRHVSFSFEVKNGGPYGSDHPELRASILCHDFQKGELKKKADEIQYKTFSLLRRDACEEGLQLIGETTHLLRRKLLERSLAETAEAAAKLARKEAEIREALVIHDA